MCKSLAGVAANYREPDIQIGPTINVAEFKERVREICRLETRHGPIPAVVARRIADALYHAENGYYWHGVKRSVQRVALLVLVSDICRAVEEGMGIRFKVSDGQNPDGSIRHCRNGKFLRALLESCQIFEKTPWRIPAQLAPLVDSSRTILAQSVQ